MLGVTAIVATTMTTTNANTRSLRVVINFFPVIKTFFWRYILAHRQKEVLV
jgi:hypothetical protein